MNEVLYGLNSALIAGLLLVLMVLAIEIGNRVGRSRQASSDALSRDHVNAIQSSLLGVLALLLAFSFSLALQRFDLRHAAVVDEANAIGTTYLRAQLLPASVRSESQALLQDYIDLRVQAGMVSLDRESDRGELLLRASTVLDALWGLAMQAASEDPGPVSSGLYIQSLNETIDSFGERNAALKWHVPEAILMLLFLAYVATGGVIGFSAGVAGHRPSFAAYILVTLIVFLAFIIVDLDRPRRGLITIDQSSLIELKAALDSAQSAGARQPPPTAEASHQP